VVAAHHQLKDVYKIIGYSIGLVYCLV